MALCPAPSVLVFFLISRQRQTNRTRSQSPFQQMRRRPAGESYRARLEELDEQIHEWLIYLAVCPAILGLAAALVRLPGVTLPATLFLASLIWTGVCGWKLRALGIQRANAELRFDG